jgi:hypothetical protein
MSVGHLVEVKVGGSVCFVLRYSQRECETELYCLVRSIRTVFETSAAHLLVVVNREHLYLREVGDCPWVLSKEMRELEKL